MIISSSNLLLQAGNEGKQNMVKITLQSAREMSGYTIKEIATHCALTEGCYRKYEDDFGKTPARVAHAIRTLLRISLDSFHIVE